MNQRRINVLIILNNFKKLVTKTKINFIQGSKANKTYDSLEIQIELIWKFRPGCYRGPYRRGICLSWLISSVVLDIMFANPLLIYF